MKREIKFKAKRTDGKGWVYGWVKPLNSASYKTLERMCIYDDILCVFEVIPETVCIGTEINGVLVYSGDIHMELDGQGNKCLLPIVFENGSFWIDESFDKDGSTLFAVSEYETPINIVGNIHDNA